MIRDNATGDKIKSLLNSKGEVLVFDEVDSTNTLLKDMALNSADEFTVVIAKSQTKGRGRLGRSFLSKNGGLYLSLLLRPQKLAEASLMVTVAAAVAVSKAIEKVCGKTTAIKWVNDLFLDGKKICGILTEGVINPKSGCLEFAVLGIGVNIVEPMGGFDEFENIAGAIYKSDTDTDVFCELSAEIINSFIGFYKKLASKEYIEEYKNRSMLIGKTVSYIKEGNTYTARVLDIDDNARLILEQNGEKAILQAGEVSVKLS
jgi:BirA family biotin operon repressor/biotin-[acetyl-CoA-carboxylase] ligase